MKIQKIVNAPITTLTLIGSLIGGASATNILVDPGFEDPSNIQSLGTTVSNFNTNQGKWGVEGGIAIGDTMGGEEGFVDESSLVITVPEPSSTLLLGLGSLGLLLRRSRS